MRRNEIEQRPHVAALANRRASRLAGVAAVVSALLSIAACADDTGRSAAVVPSTSSAPDSTAVAPASTSPITEPTTTVIPVTTVTPGDITETVPPADAVTAAPVPIGEAAEATAGVTATVVDVEPVEVEAELPGEIAGAGVAITIEIRNDTSSDLDLRGASVDLVDDTGASATPINAGTSPFIDGVAVGAARTATYVFQIDRSRQRDTSLFLTISAGEPIVVFSGDLA